MDKRRISIFLAIGFLLGSAGIALALVPPNCAPISDGVPVSSPSYVLVTVEGDSCMDLQTAWPDSDTIAITTDAGNMTIASSDPGEATVHKDNITGTWTYVSGIFATSSDITLDPADKQSIAVGGSIQSVEFTSASNVEIDDNSKDFGYSSSGAAIIELSGVESNTAIGAYDQSGTLVGYGTSDSSGNLRIENLESGTYDVELNALNPSTPTLSNPSPEGDLSTPPSQISVDVNDTDFPNDEVDITIDLDGSQIHTETITANQSVSVSLPQSGKNGGVHTWTVEAEDQYGRTDVESVEYSVPDTITIRNETNHSEIIDSPIESTVRFFGEDQIYTRTTSDGTINMTGLPVDQDFIVEIEPTGNYTSRTVYIQSIYEQRSVYLLNESAYNTIDARFQLEDPTGQYGSDTVLFIQKPITINGTTTWQTIHADEFGTEGVTATLQEDQRYRTKIQNPAGEVQVIGPYRSDLSETVTIRPGTPTIELGDFQDGWAANAELDNRTLEYRYSDPDMSTDSVTVWVHEKGDTSTTLQPNETYFNLGNFSAQSTLTENESEKTWVVNFVVEREDGTSVYQETVSNNANLVPDMSREWRLIPAILFLILLASAASVVNRAAGAVITAMTGGILYWTGWLSGATTAVAVTLAIFIAVIYATYVTESV